MENIEDFLHHLSYAVSITKPEHFRLSLVFHLPPSVLLNRSLGEAVGVALLVERSVGRLLQTKGLRLGVNVILPTPPRSLILIYLSRMGKLKMNLFVIMKFISTKELRASLPAIRKQLARGQEYFLIFQSRPVAKLIPIDGLEEASDGDVEKAAALDIDSDFLTQKEIAYYLALK